MSLQQCNQADPSCEGQTHTRCFSCGMPACRECSVVLPYYRYSHKRVCHNCITDRAEELYKQWTPVTLAELHVRGVDLSRIRLAGRTWDKMWEDDIPQTISQTPVARTS